ncbi:Innexin, partial [Trinorchestia longiramus]
MPIAGAATTNNFISQAVTQVVKLVKRKKNSPPPSDCFVLRMHYNYGFWLFGFLFWATFHQWHSKDPLTCVSHFNAESQIRYDYLNFCLTYLFVASDEDLNQRRYLFFYRWLHWLMFVVAIVYFLIRKFAKSFENAKLRKLCSDVCQGSSNYDINFERGMLEKVVTYLIDHLGSHSPVYINSILAVCFALCVDLTAFWFVDYLLHNRFYRYGLFALSTARDTDNYSDYISRTFPPFAKCQLESQHQLTADRDELFGCHLGLMEVYEKLFFFVWVYLVVVIIVTVGYIVKLAFYAHPYFQKLALKPKSPMMTREYKDVDLVVMKVIKHCKVGDIYVLLKLKAYLSDTRFYMLLCRLSEPTLATIVSNDPTTLPNNRQKKPPVVPQGKPGMYNNNQVHAMMAMRGQKG